MCVDVCVCVCALARACVYICSLRVHFFVYTSVHVRACVRVSPRPPFSLKVVQCALQARLYNASLAVYAEEPYESRVYAKEPCQSGLLNIKRPGS